MCLFRLQIITESILTRFSILFFDALSTILFTDRATGVQPHSSLSTVGVNALRKHRSETLKC
jgi:hypothetical protein